MLISYEMNSTIILAAGQGQRLKERHDKMLIIINNKPLIYYTLMAFATIQKLMKW